MCFTQASFHAVTHHAHASALLGYKPRVYTETQGLRNFVGVCPPSLEHERYYKDLTWFVKIIVN